MKPKGVSAACWKAGTETEYTSKAAGHVTGAGVLVTGNGTSFQNLLRSPSIGSFAAQVQQDQMVVRTP